MTIKFAELEIYVCAEGDITLKQFLFGEDDQIIGFPPHQAKAICAAILKLAEEQLKQ